MVWTHFWDMHSGGRQKLDWSHIFIEAPIDEAKIIFQNRFGRNPERVTCTCCGDDYSIDEYPDLAQGTGYERKCRYAYFSKEGEEIPEEKAWKSGGGYIDGAYGKWVEEEDKKQIKKFERQYPKDNWKEYFKHIPLQDYLKKKEILVIREKDIKAEERDGELRPEGYIWAGVRR